MTPLEIKRQIIKDTITPFFKGNGFIKKGVTYFNTINHLTVEAWVQTLRYYKIENTDAFRIDIKIYPDNVMHIYFGCYYIPRNSSHITITENTNMDELKINLQNELNEFAVYLDKYNNIEQIIQEQQKEIEELENTIMEKSKKLGKETQNKNLINILKNTINNCEKSISIIKNWIKIVNE
jgi:hypothetical protein